MRTRPGGILKQISLGNNGNCVQDTNQSSVHVLGNRDGVQQGGNGEQNMFNFPNTQHMSQQHTVPGVLFSSFTQAPETSNAVAAARTGTVTLTAEQLSNILREQRAGVSQMQPTHQQPGGQGLLGAGARPKVYPETGASSITTGYLIGDSVFIVQS